MIFLSYEDLHVAKRLREEHRPKRARHSLSIKKTWGTPLESLLSTDEDSDRNRISRICNWSWRVDWFVLVLYCRRLFP